MTVTDWSPTDSVYRAAAPCARAAREHRPGRGAVAGARPVLDSWRRSLAAVRLARAPHAPLEGDGWPRLSASLLRHAAAAALTPIEPAVEAGLVVALGDAAGRLLWVEGRSSVTARADEMGFAEGADWSEPAMGTSAPALALTTGTPFQVVGAEHFHEAVHAWSCSAVPVLDPRTGRAVGVLDVTGSADAVAPLVLPLLEATSRAVQEELRRQGARRPPRTGAAVDLLLTGRRAPLLRCGEQEGGARRTSRRAAHPPPSRRRRHPRGGAGRAAARHRVGRGDRARRSGCGCVGSSPRRAHARDRLRPVCWARSTPTCAAPAPPSTAATSTPPSPPPRRAVARLRGARDPPTACTDRRSPARARARARRPTQQLWAYAQRSEAAEDLDVLMAILQVAAPDAPERSAASARAQELRGERAEPRNLRAT